MAKYSAAGLTRANQAAVRRSGSQALYEYDSASRDRTFGAIMQAIGIGESLYDRIQKNRERDEFVRNEFRGVLEEDETQNRISKLLGGTRYRNIETGKLLEKEDLAQLKFLVDSGEVLRTNVQSLLDQRRDMKNAGEIDVEAEDSVEDFIDRALRPERSKVGVDQQIMGGAERYWQLKDLKLR